MNYDDWLEEPYQNEMRKTEMENDIINEYLAENRDAIEAEALSSCSNAMIIEEFKTREFEDEDGVMPVFFRSPEWCLDGYDICENEDSDYRITIGHGWVSKPEIPDTDVWRLMREGHTLENAKRAVAEAYVTLKEAKEVLAQLTAIPHLEG